MKKILLVVSGLVFVSQNLLAQTFGYYYGNIHSQTSYSDGNQDSSASLMTKPWQAYNYAKLSQQINFYGISDHNHVSAGMTNKAHFHMGVADANAANIDGSFVAMYGTEWGVISGGGHVIVYGTDSLMGWDPGVYDIFVAQNNYSGLWSAINARPGSFAYLAHPQPGDYTNMLTTPVNAAADNAVVGLPARSGPAFSTNSTYSNPSTGNYILRYKEGLSQGYHIGIGLDHDTHNSVFGRQTAGRMVVLAPALTRYNIMDAIRKMRFYSSDDWNVKVDFNINSQPLGGIYTHSTAPTLSVNISDPDIESTTSITVYYGVPGSGTQATILTSNTGSNTLSFTHNIANLSTYYYFLEIKQADGDMIWTSPIWYTRNNGYTANAPNTAFSVSPVLCVNKPITLTDNSTNGPTAWSWTLLGSTTPSSTAQNPVVTYTAAGTYSIVLITSNATGTGLPITTTISVKPNPVVTTLTSNTLLCVGQSATLTASGALTYTWNTGVTMPNLIITPTVTTNYTVTGTNSVSCTNSSVITQSVSTCAGIKEVFSKPIFEIFPNPTSGEFTLKVGNLTEGASVEVYDNLGKLMLTKILSDSVTTLNLNGKSAGIYYLKVLEKKKIIYTEKIVKYD